MISLGFLVGLCIAFFVIALIGLFVSFFCYAKIVGMENSTHRIEYRDPLAGLDDDDDIEDDSDVDFNPFGGPDGTNSGDKLPNLYSKKEAEKQKIKYEREAGLALAGLSQLDD